MVCARAILAAALAALLATTAQAQVVLTTSTPSDGATGVASTASISLDFDQNVAVLPGVFLLVPQSSGSTIAVPTSSVSVASDIISFTPPEMESGPTGQVWSLVIDPDVVEAAGGADTFPGTTISFTVADNTPAELASVTPADGTTEVSLTPTITLTFNEPVTAAAATATFTGSVGGDTTAAVTTGGGSTITLSPTLTSNNGQEYEVTVPAGAVLDAASNPTTAAITFAFSVVDSTAPTLAAHVPQDGDTDVASTVTIALVYSEPVALSGSGTVTLTANGGAGAAIAVPSGRVSVSGSTVFIDPASDLPQTASGGESYRLDVSAGFFEDLATTPNDAAAVQFTFGVADTVAPSVTTLSPTNGATGVALSANVVLAFNEDVALGTGTVAFVSQLGGDTTFVDIATAGTVGPSTTVTINPPADLPSGQTADTFTVVVPSGSITDTATVRNAFPGFSLGEYTFGVVDAVEAGLVSVSPADGTTEVSLTPTITLTFNEPVTAAAATSAAFDGATGGNTTAVVTTGAGTTVTLSPTLTSRDGQVYTVTVPAGAILDAAANPNSAPISFSYTVVDSTAPSLDAVAPANNTVDVATSASFTLTFSETVLGQTGNALTAGTIDFVPVLSDAAVLSVSVFDTTQVAIDGNTMVVTPTNLQSGVQYELTMGSTALTDRATNPNAFAGLSNHFFTTADPSTSAWYNRGGLTAQILFPIVFAAVLAAVAAAFLVVKRNNASGAVASHDGGMRMYGSYRPDRGLAPYEDDSSSHWGRVHQGPVTRQWLHQNGRWVPVEDEEAIARHMHRNSFHEPATPKGAESQFIGANGHVAADPRTGRVFFYNPETRESTWVPEPDYPGQSPPRPQHYYPNN